MSTSIRSRAQPTGLTFERAILVALLIHLLGGLLGGRWRELLLPEEILRPDPAPIEFRFVDTPDTELPEIPPDTEALSDRDRRAADASERDRERDPFSEGNTPEQVLRAPEAATPALPTPPRPDVRPTPERREAEAAEEVAETGETAAETPPDTAAERAETTPPRPLVESLPPRPEDLRRSLSRLESFVDPQVYDNRAGGAPDSRSLAQFDTRGYDLGPYLRQVLRTIEANWRSNIPPLIRTGVGGATFVALSIRRQLKDDGTEVALIVAERSWASGQPAYDTAALFALELSSPLPPIPEYYPFEAITGRLGFIYNMDPARVVFPDDQR